MHSYSNQRLLKDISAGVAVGIVALPLAMAFAMASGLKPEAGIFTAIIAGFLISALGGSRVQIGGPAGAFIAIVYGIVERYGLANLIIATAMSGVMLFAMGLFKLAALSAILIFVACNMGQWREFANLRQYRVPYRLTLLSVFFLTVIFDLTVAVEVGLIAACVTFIYRFSSLSRSEQLGAAGGVRADAPAAGHRAAQRAAGATGADPFAARPGQWAGLCPAPRLSRPGAVAIRAQRASMRV